jgi:feruloyl esterase
VSEYRFNFLPEVTRHKKSAFEERVLRIHLRYCNRFVRAGVRSALYVAVASLPLALTPALAFAAPAGMPKCTVEELSSLGVPKVTITAATDVAAAGQNPEICDVKGLVETEGNSAGFELRLPANWNGKFLFFGVGGLAGAMFPAVSPSDAQAALRQGYASAITDAGHTAPGADARWALASPGVPNTAKVLDYYYRAAHEVTVAAKILVVSFFDSRTIKRSYFEGCSNGGRMALMEAERYPDDYDGIIAGAPFMSAAAILPTAMRNRALSQMNYIPPSILERLDQEVYAECDAVDGVKDGLIQNPARCSFNTKTLVCKAGETANCLSPTQADALRAYFRAIRDSRGNLVYPGLSVSDLGGRSGASAWTLGTSVPNFDTAELWTAANSPLGWQFTQAIIRYMVELDPNYNVRTFDVHPDGVVGDAALKLFNEKTDLLGVGDATKLTPFIQKDKKLLMYHGFSDPALTPYRTVQLYEDLAALTPGGYPRLQANVRLFMVPGMLHCGGGPGPNFFAALAALDRWVERGVAPDQILATKYVKDTASEAVARTMPLCPFPQQAKYHGTGDINEAASWSCSDTPSLLEVGPNGIEAGLTKK